MKIKIMSIHPNYPPCNGEFEATVHESTDNGLYVSIPNFGCSRTYYNVDKIQAIENLLREHGAELKLPCRYCGKWTSYFGTRQCNWCWEVSSRVEDMQPGVINKIMLEKSGDYEYLICQDGIQLTDICRKILVLQAKMLYPHAVEYRQRGGKWKLLENIILIHQPDYFFRLRPRSPRPPSNTKAVTGIA